ncbi:MAG: AAA family ATPase [Bryobacterales bacterium]|nr:AAA family ATPase [Bryobacterales bacterium]
MSFPYVFTFYSFKGGVGRSMAMMNVAYWMAGHGRHVLMVDMDLEAPGISSFLQRNNELAPPASDYQEDLVSLLSLMIDGVRSGMPLPELRASLPPLSRYLRSVDPEKLAPLRSKYGELGRLDVLGLDVSAGYSNRIAALNLHLLDREQLVQLSSLLRAYLKAHRFPFRPTGIEEFEPPDETSYDYVLVDSRTGITEIGGICVGPLADRLVVVTGLNDQNIEGTRHFLEETGIEIRPRAPDDEPWDDAVRFVGPSLLAQTLGPKPTIIVASPVPHGDAQLKAERLGALRAKLGVEPRTLSYHSQVALMERIFVRDFQREHLSTEYVDLASTLLGLAEKVLLSEISMNRVLSYASDTSSEDTLRYRLLDIEVPRISDSRHRRRALSLLSHLPEQRTKALVTWGYECIALAVSAPEPDATRYLRSAADRLQTASAEDPEGAPNRVSEILLRSARRHAVQGNATEALRYLEALRADGQLSQAQWESNLAANAFDPIRETPEFQAFLNTVRNKEQRSS